MNFKEWFNAHIDVIENFSSSIPLIERAAQMIVHSLQSGGTLFVCGNWWSAADAQHIVAEFTWRYVRERKSLSAVALTVDTSAITAIGNDYWFDRIFSRQIEWLGKKGDILLAISTSWNSQNIVEAVIQAKLQHIQTIGLLGKDGGKLKDLVDCAIVAPSQTTARIQECHILAYHSICEYVDDVFAGGP
jgi:D-sedoheptulose 7-phosphate isomerase